MNLSGVKQRAKDGIAPDWSCERCDQPATHGVSAVLARNGLVYEARPDDFWPTFCKAHAEEEAGLDS